MLILCSQICRYSSQLSKVGHGPVPLPFSAERSVLPVAFLQGGHQPASRTGGWHVQGAWAGWPCGAEKETDPEWKELEIPLNSSQKRRHVWEQPKRRKRLQTESPTDHPAHSKTEVKMEKWWEIEDEFTGDQAPKSAGGGALGGWRRSLPQTTSRWSRRASLLRGARF